MTSHTTETERDGAGTGTGVPEGYAAVPVHPGQEHAPLQLCVLVRRDPEAAGGSFVVLRDRLVGRALLGCIVDAGGIVHDWLEYVVQDVGLLAGAPEMVRGCQSNAVVDARWAEDFEAAQALDARAVVRTGHEREHPAPVYVDLERGIPVVPTDAGSGHAFALCRDEAALAARGLPPYGSTLHRYLYVPELGGESPFVPVTADAPGGEATVALTEVVERADRLIPLNAQGGLTQARRYSPIGIGGFADVIGGAPWTGLLHGKSVLPVEATLRGLSQSSTLERLLDGHLVLGGRGQAGRLIEVFHLKLRLIADAVAAVQAAVAAGGRPLLNIDADSFQVRLGAAGVALPLLWTARAELTEPGAAAPLPIEGSDLTYYLPGQGDGASRYRPASGRAPVRGQGRVRLRRVMEEQGDALVLEGTLETQESVEMDRHDLLWLRVHAGAGPINLYATADGEHAMAAGEARFRTVGQRFDAARRSALEALEGVPVDAVPFEVVPLLSTPCDLYALAVLALRVLVVDRELSLPVALDEMLSLARRCAAETEGDLADRLDALLVEDSRWIESLGPQHLVSDEIAPAEAFSFVPRALWAQALALLVRMLPGIGPDSLCADLGDAVPGGLARTFDPVLEELEAILRRSRSLIVVDWADNRELHAVVRRHAVGLG